MTLFARSSTRTGIVSPICFAAFKLITNSNFVACCTANPADLPLHEPTRLLVVYPFQTAISRSAAALFQRLRGPAAITTISYGNRYEKLILALAEFGIPENQFWEVG